MSKILPDGTRLRARLFNGFLSHYVLRDRYGRPGKGNDKGNAEGLVGFSRRNFYGADPALRDMGGIQRPPGGAVPKAPGRHPAGPDRE